MDQLGIVTLANSAHLSSFLSPDFGAGRLARLAFPDPEPPATDSCIVPRRLKLTMPSPPRCTIRPPEHAAPGAAPLSPRCLQTPMRCRRSLLNHTVERSSGDQFS